jgi:hypothetical protein
VGIFTTLSIRSRLAVDASPSGPDNARSGQPGLTPFAGILRPVGAVGFGIVDVASAPLGHRWVPFRAEIRLPPCTRAHALRWQITPGWGCRGRCCGDLHYVIDPFSIGSRWVPFRAEIRLPRLYQGSRPSLADYAPLGLSRSLLWGFSLRHRSVLDWLSMRPLQGRTILAPANQGSRLILFS